MVQLTTLFAVLALSSPIAFSYPISRRDLSNDDLLQNGLEAQKLNAAFQTLQGSDSCTDGDVACVEGQLAQCQGTSWVTQSCPSSLQCFALPDVDKQGVSIGCTSAQTADELIAATGAQGGANAEDPANSTSIALGGSNATTGISTVTVTVTLPSDGDTQTLSPSTATLTPDEAGSIISGASPAPTDPAVAVAANGSSGTTIVLSGTDSSSDPAATPAPAIGGVQGGLAAAPTATGTTILLNGGAAPTDSTTTTSSGPAATGTPIDLNGGAAPANGGQVGVAAAPAPAGTTILLNGGAAPAADSTPTASSSVADAAAATPPPAAPAGYSGY